MRVDYWAGFAVAAVIVMLFAVWRKVRIRARRADRRRRQMARQRAWDWLMRRPRHHRLTDQRPYEDR